MTVDGVVKLMMGADILVATVAVVMVEEMLTGKVS